MSYHFLSWNVDGYNDAIHNWLKRCLEEDAPDIVFLSETKRTPEELHRYFQDFDEYTSVINSHQPKQWHGVAMLVKREHWFEELPIKMNIPIRKDTKSNEAATGRIIAIQLNNELNVIGSYTPNSGQHDPVKLAYRTQIWDPTFFQILEILRTSSPTVWLGDINVALTNEDVSDPIQMQHFAGFTPAERINFYTLLSAGNWVDPWRIQHPLERQYSWVGYHRKPDYGMRIDNIVVSSDLIKQVQDTYIFEDGPRATDHLPIGIIIQK